MFDKNSFSCTKQGQKQWTLTEKRTSEECVFRARYFFFFALSDKLSAWNKLESSNDFPFLCKIKNIAFCLSIV